MYQENQKGSTQSFSVLFVNQIRHFISICATYSANEIQNFDAFSLTKTYKWYRKIAKTSRPYIKMSTLKIWVIFEILLNSIVYFLQFSSGYIRVQVIIKVVVFSRFYSMSQFVNTKCRLCRVQEPSIFYLTKE